LEECKRWFDLAAARDELDRALGARRETLADWQRIALDWNPVASPMPRWVESRLLAWADGNVAAQESIDGRKRSAT